MDLSHAQLGGYYPPRPATVPTPTGSRSKYWIGQAGGESERERARERREREARERQQVTRPWSANHFELGGTTTSPSLPPCRTLPKFGSALPLCLTPLSFTPKTDPLFLFADAGAILLSEFVFLARDSSSQFCSGLGPGGLRRWLNLTGVGA